jgi:tripartite ATP-independent transporter DctM subunit
MIWVLLFALMFLGAPIAVAMGASATIILLFAASTNPVVIVQHVVSSLDSFTMLALPLFMMAAAIMCATSVGDRIFSFAGVLVRHLPGGMAHVNVLSSAIMSGMSGSSTSDVAGLGRLEIKAMEKAGFDTAFSAGTTAATATLSSIIPPSTAMVLYGSITGVSVGKLLMGGLIPGVLSAIMMMVMCYFISKRRGYPLQEKAKGREILYNFRRSFLALLMPVLLVGGILSGIFTATEAAAFCVLYAMFVTMAVYRELNFRSLFTVLKNISTFVCATLFICAFAQVFGLVLTYEHIPEKICAFFLSLSDSKYMILFFINVMLLILGCVMDGNAIYLIVGPIVYVIGNQLGVDPVHLGVIVVFNVTLGMLTPPVGLLLFVTQKVAGITSSEMVRGVAPFLVCQFATLFLITYIPAISLWLPNLI